MRPFIDILAPRTRGIDSSSKAIVNHVPKADRKLFSENDSYWERGVCEFELPSKLRKHPNNPGSQSCGNSSQNRRSWNSYLVYTLKRKERLYVAICI